MFVQSCSKFNEFVHIDRGGHIVVRDILFRVGQSLCNNLSDLTILNVCVQGGRQVSNRLGFGLSGWSG